MKVTPAKLASMIMIFLLMLGTGLALSDSDPFWAGVGVWAILIAFAPVVVSRTSNQVLPWWFLAPISLPFLVGLLAISPTFQPFDMASLGYWVLTSISLFALCLVTLLFIERHSGMRLSLPLGILTTFLLYESVVALQGPIGYYCDLWLGTNFVPNNTILMVYIVVATISGLIMATVVNRVLRWTPFDRLLDQVVGEVGN